MPNSNLSKVVYVTPAQYNNWKELGAILLFDGSEKGQKAYDLLVEMFESLKKEDYQSYENKTSDMMAQLKMQSVEIREKINALSAKNYSDVRI